MTLSTLPLPRSAPDRPHPDSYCSVADLALLGLRLADGVPATHSPITWVIETELPDPAPVVVPGALVLTRGTQLADADAQVTHVRQLKRAGAAALGWTAEPGRTPEVPAATVRAAREARLSVLIVPPHIAAAEVSAFVAHRLSPPVVAGEAEAERLCGLLESAASGAGVAATITALSRSLDQPLRLVTTDGIVLAQYPPATTTQPTAAAVEDQARRHEVRRPVVIDGVTQAYLVTSGRPAPASTVRFALALLGLELGREVTEAITRRRAFGQVLEDVVGRVLSDEEARRRLCRLGIDVDARHTVVLATVSDDASDLLDTPVPLLRPGVAGAGPAGAPEAVIAMGPVENALCFLLSADAEAFAAQLHTALLRHSRLVRIGIGGSLQGLEGLRTSYLEAREGATRGAGVNRRKALTLAGLLRAQESVSLTELAKETLQPLVDSDSRSQADLVTTLRVLLEEDFSVARAAETLFVHRNTVKYRISQIERLTGLDLSCTADRTQVWVAMSALSSRD